MSLIELPLDGRATVAWYNQDHENMSALTIRDVAEGGGEALISLTEYYDLDNRSQLLELRDIAREYDYLQFIVATRHWVIPEDERSEGDLSRLRAVSRIPNISLGLVCDHETGVYQIRGSTICWDYTRGTPSSPITAKCGRKKVALRDHAIIGVCDWLTRAKVSRQVPPAGRWYEFERPTGGLSES